MTILSSDIKLFQAQDNTDNDSGGGSRTSNEVVDGAVNNLFPDISRIDTVSGDVALRKVFPTVTTNNQDIYYGAHAILRKTPTDSKVSALLFHTNDPHDRRVAAQDKIESYVTGSYLEQFWLYGSHIVGAKAVTFLENLEAQVPDVGSVYLLKQGANEQYIRVTSVEALEITLTYDNSPYKRRRIICLIDQPLNYAFVGSAFHPSGQLPNTALTFATQVGAESKFYGTKNLSQDAAIDDTSLQVNSIYEQIVPATKQTTPLVNRNAVSVGENLVPSGEVKTVLVALSSSMTNGSAIQLPDAITPKSMTKLYYDVSDDGFGNLLDANNDNIGTVDYKAGLIKYTGSSFVGSGNITVTYEPANIFSSNIQYTGDVLVDNNNQAYNYIRNLSPMPSPLDLYVDYRAQGKWYRLFNGDNNSALGNLNLQDNFDGTGTVTATLAFVPDIDSSVIFSWGSNERLVNRNTFVASETQAYLEIDLGQKNIDPVSFNWQLYMPAFATIKNVTVDASNKLVVPNNYFSGELDVINGVLRVLNSTGFNAFENKPTANNTIIDFNYSADGLGDSGEIKTVVASRTPAGNEIAFSAEDTSAGTLSFSLGETVQINAVSLTLRLASDKIITLITNSTGQLLQQGRHFSDNTTWGSVAANGLVSIQFTNWTRNVVSAGFSGTFGSAKRFESFTSKNSLHNGTDTIAVTYRAGNPGSYPLSHNITDKLENIAVYKIKTLPNIVGEVGFTFLDNSISGYFNLYSKSGFIYNQPSSTGFGAAIGTIDYHKGVIEIPYFSDPVLLYIKFNKLFSDDMGDSADVMPNMAFRTASTKLTTSSFQLRYQTANGSYQVLSDDNGVLWASIVNGVGSGLPTDIDQAASRIDTLTGMVSIKFTSPAIPESIKYDAIAETTLPLDPELLGLDPVRLPADGRVPVFANGRHLVIFHEANTPIGTPTNGQVVNLSRSGQAYIEVIDSEGKRLDSAQYVADRSLGTVTFANPVVLQDTALNVLTPPFAVIDRIENMLLATDVEVNGLIKLSGSLSFAFPKDETKVASALVWTRQVGARVFNLFAQEIWDNGNPVWSDTLIGDPTTAQYDEINQPLIINNNSSVSGRWAIIFTSATTIKVAEEKLGIVLQNVSISIDDVAPINPATNQPYFTMPKEGFGAGWVQNNVIRFNTDSGDANMWVIRTVQSGALSEATDSIDIEIRGDAN